MAKNKKRKIFLVGMPGVGKSTIGKLAAEKLGWNSMILIK